MKLIFSEYGWPETIASDNGPCYSAESFTKLMTEYSVSYITSSPHYLPSNGLAEKYVQIVKNLFYKAKEEWTDLNKSLMIYRNTLLSHRLQSPLQILQSRTTRTQLPMSNTARIQQGLGSEQLRVTNKNEHLPTHDYHIGQSVMYLSPINKRWYSARIIGLCQEPRSCKIVLCKVVWLLKLFSLIVNMSRGKFTAFMWGYCNTQLLVFRVSFLCNT